MQAAVLHYPGNYDTIERGIADEPDVAPGADLSRTAAARASIHQWRIMAKFDISVVMAVEGRGDALPAILSSLEKQRLPAARYEVVLVFYGDSPKEHRQRAERHAAGAPMAVKILYEPSPNQVRAKNLGAVNTDGALLLFLDQDLYAGPQLLAAHVEAHSRADRPAAVLGPIKRSPSLPNGALTRWFMKHDLELMHSRTPDSPFVWSTCHCSLPRDSFLTDGGFNEMYCALRAADIVLAQRLKRSGNILTGMTGAPAYIWHQARFEEERRRFWREGYDLCKLSLAQKNPEIMYHFQISSSPARYRLDGLFTPFYVQACQVPQLDVRIHGMSCRRVFYHDRSSGARAAQSGHPPEMAELRDVAVETATGSDGAFEA